VIGVSIPAHKGVCRGWNYMEARYFPERYQRYQEEKAARDKELRQAEDGASDRVDTRTEGEGGER
jgi:hypothetical protein